MSEMILKTPAKINLLLDVKSKRADGYHEIESFFYTVSLYDYITITEINGVCQEGFSISCDKAGIPCNEKNICWKAAAALEKFTGKAFMNNVHIDIQKNIPSQAGMGGGSTDAAAVMIGLNKMFNLNLSKEELIEVGAGIGADVPFFFEGGCAFTYGIGEKLEPVSTGIEEFYLCIAKGTQGVSTADGYRAVDNRTEKFVCSTENIKKALVEGNLQDIALNCGNIFTDATEIEEVNAIKKIMIENGALNSEMTGSGSAVFGIFNDEKSAEKCNEILKKQFGFSAVCKAGNYKPQII